MKAIFENDIVKVSETGRDYDFVAVVENKIDRKIQLIFDVEGLEPETMTIDGNDWCGVVANYGGRLVVEELKSGRFLVEVTR